MYRVKNIQDGEMACKVNDVVYNNFGTSKNIYQQSDEAIQYLNEVANEGRTSKH